METNEALPETTAANEDNQKRGEFCKICGAGPYLPSGLGSHKRSVHNITGTSVAATYAREHGDKPKVGRPRKMETCPYCPKQHLAVHLNKHISKAHPGKPLVNPAKSDDERARHRDADRKRRMKVKEAKGANGAVVNPNSEQTVDPFVHGFAVATCRKEIEAIAERSEVDLALLTAAVKHAL